MQVVPLLWGEGGPQESYNLNGMQVVRYVTSPEKTMRREIPLRNLKTWANSIKARVLFETTSPNTVLRMCAWKPALAFSIVTMIKRTRHCNKSVQHLFDGS